MEATRSVTPEMNNKEMREHVRRDRTELLELLESLTRNDWETPSLCAGRAVRDVVAHLVAYDQFDPSIAWHFVRSGFSVDRVNVRTAAAWRRKSIDALLARLRANVVPGGITRLIGWHVALQDIVVHQQDVRRPLGRLRSIPAERVIAVLECLVDPPSLSGVQNRSGGLRLEATDIGWSWGDGALVAGAGEAIMMGLAGRQSVLEELTGPGVSKLRE